MAISAFLIVFNEEKRLSRSIASLDWVDEIVVVDGGSADRTAEICKNAGVQLFPRPFDNFANQKNYALSLTRHEWVLSIDADEIVPPVLAKEIETKVRESPNSIQGYFIKRRNYFLGKPLRFGRQGNEKILRLFRKESGVFVGDVHELVRVRGNTGVLENTFDHFGTQNFSEYFEKLRLYTSLEANRLIQENRVPSHLEAALKPPTKWVLNYIFFFLFLH